MNKGLHYNITDTASAFEVIIGNTIDKVTYDEVRVTEATGEMHIEEATTIETSNQARDSKLGRNVEFIGEDCFLSEEYLVVNKEDSNKEVRPCQENPKAKQP